MSASSLSTDLDAADRFVPFTGPSHKLRDDGTFYASQSPKTDKQADKQDVHEVFDLTNDEDPLADDLSNIILLEDYKHRCDEMRVMSGSLHSKMENVPRFEKMVPHLDDIIFTATTILSELDDALPTNDVVTKTNKQMDRIEKIFGIAVAFAKDSGILEGTPQDASPTSPTNFPKPKYTQAQKRGLPEPSAVDDDDVPLMKAKQKCAMEDDVPLDRLADAVLDVWGEAESSTMDGMFDDVFGGLCEEPTPPRRKRRHSKGPAGTNA